MFTQCQLQKYKQFQIYKLYLAQTQVFNESEFTYM